MAEEEEAVNALRDSRRWANEQRDQQRGNRHDDFHLRLIPLLGRVPDGIDNFCVWAGPQSLR